MKITEVIMDLIRWAFIASPLVLFLIPVLFFIKSRFPKKPVLLGVYFGILYLILIGLVAYHGGGDEAGGWLWAGLLSKPASYPALLLIGQFEKLNSNWGMFVGFSIFGTAQYFLIGLIVGWLYVRQKK